MQKGIDQLTFEAEGVVAGSKEISLSRFLDDLNSVENNAVAISEHERRCDK